LPMCLFSAMCKQPSQEVLAKSTPILKREFIYETAPFPSCHASTIVETRSHQLIAAWFGGTAESNTDVVIYSSRLEKGLWTPPTKIADGKSGDVQFACYNPVLFQPSTGPLMLFYKFGTGPQHWSARLETSLNDGVSWSQPAELPPGMLGPIKNKPIELSHHVILCPSSSEQNGWRVHFEWTADLGATWNRGPDVNDPALIGAIQPTILNISPNHLRAVGRTQQGKVFAIDSEDNGKSWSRMYLLDVPNPNSGTDALRLKDGRYLLVYNHTTTGRSPLNVAISADAEHWSPILTLEASPGEYSYPAIIQTHDGLVHITYTWQRRRISHIVIDPQRMTAR